MSRTREGAAEMERKLNTIAWNVIAIITTCFCRTPAEISKIGLLRQFFCPRIQRKYNTVDCVVTEAKFSKTAFNSKKVKGI